MLLSKSSLGISFGDDRVDLVSLRRFFGKTTVVKHLSIPFAYGMKNEEFESSVSDFLKVNRLQRMMPYVALPRRDCILLPLELPVTAEENLREVLGYELDNYTPFSVNTAYFYFQNLGYTLDGGKVKILLCVIDKERLNYYIDLLKIVGLEPISMEVSSTAFARTISFDNNLTTGKNVMLYLGTNTCEISIHGKRGIEYSSAFDRKGQTVETISNEYKRLFSFDISWYKIAEIEKVMVAGDEEPDEGLLKEISNVIGKEVVKVEAFNGIDIRDVEGLHLYRVALGCGLIGLNGDTLALNFIPVKADSVKIGGTLRFTALILLIFLLSLWMGEFTLRIYKESKTLKQLKEKIAVVERSAITVENLKKEAIGLEGRFPQLDNFSKRRVLFLSVLKELTDVIPLDTYLTVLKYHENEIEIVGRSASAVALLSLLEASPMFKNAEFSATVKRREAARERLVGGTTIAGRVIQSAPDDTYLENFSIKAKLEGSPP